MDGPPDRPFNASSQVKKFEKSIILSGTGSTAVGPDRTQREQATLRVFGNAKVLPSSSRLAQLPGTIRNSPFTITVPIEEDFGGLIDYVKEATPSVRDKDHGNFRFYKPPLDNPICVSQSHHGFPLTREYLGSALLITCKVNEEFQEKGDDHRFDIDVIVHVDSGGRGGVALHRLSAESNNGLLRHVTFRLRNRDEIELLPEARLFDNNISELLRDETLPSFVQQLEQKLRLRCSPKHDMITLPLLDSVKMLLGDDVFSEYFTDMNDESETRCVTAVELLHYIDILLDQHLSNQEAYRNKSVSHIYSLLRRFATASLPQRGAKFQLFDYNAPHDTNRTGTSRSTLWALWRRDTHSGMSAPSLVCGTGSPRPCDDETLIAPGSARSSSEEGRTLSRLDHWSVATLTCDRVASLETRRYVTNCVSGRDFVTFRR
ncbi:hypothetical protein EDB85DRAFT_1904224 [Lactarius pseudohatsudake]|nr:hypothetical protein EDB85DRAFT_1904224 [Lactarius pseudohatsudake]